MRSTTLEVDTELAGARKAALDELFDSQGPDGNQDRQLPPAPRGRRRSRNPEARADGTAVDAIARDAAIQQGYQLHSASRLGPDRLPLKDAQVDVCESPCRDSVSAPVLTGSEARCGGGITYTINRPSQPSRRVSHHLISCAAFHSQIRSQHNKQQSAPAWASQGRDAGA